MEKARGRITSMEAEKSVLIEEKERLEREKVEKVEELSQNYEVLLGNMREEQEKLKKEKESKLNELSAAYEGLLGDMKAQIESGQVTISNLKGRLTVNVMDEILFPSGSASVKEEGKKVLKQIGEALKNIKDKAIIIEGHTDNVPIGGTLVQKFPTNWELSTARAVSVVRFLAEAAGVEAGKLSAVGYGENRPAVPNDTPEGKAKNRRIEIKLVPMDLDLLPKPAPEQKAEETPAAPQVPAQEAGQPPQGEVPPPPAIDKALEAAPQNEPTAPAEAAPPATPPAEAPKQ
ncbi:chemotaxis protein MotB [bacterium]|nr:MAG: chemotaxis protein MotB [bacterium]